MNDDIGFEFDPFDIALSPYDGHFGELLSCERDWQWINHKGRRIDMRKAPLKYLENIRDWCIKNGTEALPYWWTPQYLYCIKRLETLQNRQNTALRALQKKRQ